MKRFLFIGLLCIFLLCSCSNNKQKANFNTSKEEQIEKEILTNLAEIHNSADLISSNPYDYTKNEYYENIVHLGNNAVLVLENMYEQGKITGVDAYISALAIEEITNCNLHEEYGFDWESAEEFYSLWKDNNCLFKK